MRLTVRPQPHLHTAHRDLKPGMTVLTRRGWRTVQGKPEDCGPHPTGTTLRVPFVGGEAAIAKPDHMWVRRVSSPLPA